LDKTTLELCPVSAFDIRGSATWSSITRKWRSNRDQWWIFSTRWWIFVFNRSSKFRAQQND